MTGLPSPPVAEAAPVDPFTMPALAPVPSRPRLLSYVGRWGRARRWLPADALRVLDVGCAYGHGAAAVAARAPRGRVVVGVERDRGHLELGRRCFPWLRILEGDAAALPVGDGTADAVLLLDVLEHLAEPDRALAEAHRVLRPGGVLVLSVPHRGALWRLDSLNLYEALRRRRPSWPRLEPSTDSGSGVHRHFTPGEVEELLGSSFAVERIARTGLGVAELVHLVRLLIRVRATRARLSGALMTLYIAAYLAEDAVPLGVLGYHLTVRARRADSGGEPS
jgi:SAM-dependent methyltransferase